MRKSAGPPRLVFMGTPSFAVPSLRILVENGLAPVAVVTGPDRGRGRRRRRLPTAVKAEAHALGIAPVLQPDSLRDEAFAARLAALKPDIIVVVAYRILPVSVYSTARLGAFNLHASLLPAYRGAAPINRALMAGESVTGVTTFFLEQRVDTGAMISQKSLEVGPNDNAGLIHDRLMAIGADAVLETVRLIAAGRAEARLQRSSDASAAPKIFPEDCRIPWHASAGEVHNHCRGLSPHPGARCRHQGVQLKILDTRPVAGRGAPGTILAAGRGRLVAACGTGAVDIRTLQQEGRRRLGAADFLNGYVIPAGDRLE